MVVQRWSREVISQKIRRLKEDGHTLRHSEVAIKHQRLVSAAVRYFGSWVSAVSSSGIDYSDIRKKSQIDRAAKVTRWSLERIDKEVKNLIDSGECLASATVRANHPALFSAAVSPRYYGSWRKTLTSQGVDYDSMLSKNRNNSSSGRNTRSRRTIISRLRVMTQGSDMLSNEEASRRYPRFYQQAVERFGSWEAATQAAFDPKSERV
jgi:hypothetical protein